MLELLPSPANAGKWNAARGEGQNNHMMRLKNLNFKVESIIFTTAISKKQTHKRFANTLKYPRIKTLLSEICTKEG